ncbi:class I SAM-dependent methyltransferase [Fusibacter paucivorans]|uniref:Class I SAM-dependent methyltransferase n=1 Tax=Fusibacter paucivorans TaxID=76009 RepID=A0ABS5PNN6_9FIRM|nr:class I SAM-dependent methyltransferase [Fusibacter paucivorans]MBS7526683.1 class I SAM-dependent methyltransferase [Fusibacter paucivorans]
MKTFGNVVNVFRVLVKGHLSSGMTVLDATSGNGHDTLFLLDLVGENGFVYAFDYQSTAIEATATRCMHNGVLPTNLKLICDSHANLDQYIESETLDAAVFNLGYLPGGDKAITTKVESTAAAIEKALMALKSGGLLYILCYAGHPSGVEEYRYLQLKLSALPQRTFDVMTVDFINQAGKPPVMWVIEKK